MTFRFPITIALTAFSTLTFLYGCKSIERAKPKPESVRADRSALINNVSPIMRGTVAQQSRLVGFQPMVVRGYGLVVGLKATGSSDMAPQVRAHMLAEMSKQGVGRHATGWGNLSPDAMLNSMETALVVVEAVVPPGAVRGTPFDVRVTAEPSTSTISLEGGTLYTTELRPGSIQAGAQQRFAMASARGPIFVNPFAEPDAVGRDTIIRTVGRVLAGGHVTEDIQMRLLLLNPSHTRVRTIMDAINTRFTQEPGQRDPTARGESDESISITIPPSYRENPTEFVELLKHTSLNPNRAERIATDIRRYVRENPSIAQTAAWRWRALGKRCLPIIKDLYDYPDELPRLAALTAGAKLDDPLVVRHLIEMTRSASDDARKQAASLLADLRVNPQIDLALRNLLNDSDLDVRLTAYEALAQRRTPYLQSYIVEGKFILDVVESDYPLIYISQQGQPRIAIFGNDLRLQPPLTVRAWSDRLLLKERTDDQIEVYYRPAGNQSGSIHQISTDLVELTTFLAHETTIESPRSGLNLSYGEVVGALHEIWRGGYFVNGIGIEADFRAEQDRIRAAILDRTQVADVTERPEFAEDNKNDATDALNQGMDRDNEKRFLPRPEIAPPEDKR